ncbi:hypothetical protein DFH09DRAFT_1089874 [Mycena vulgaris]|nr:hypothetical protein DFH09DRAFT_1089874 [Mycena vulgaris]
MLKGSHLIHLELFDGLNDEDEDVASWTGIRALPHLTHLSLDTYRHLALVPHLLDACKSLPALIILRHRPGQLTPRATECAILAQDPRFRGDAVRGLMRRLAEGRPERGGLLGASGCLHRQENQWGNRS